MTRGNDGAALAAKHAAELSEEVAKIRAMSEDELSAIIYQDKALERELQIRTFKMLIKICEKLGIEEELRVDVRQ